MFKTYDKSQEAKQELLGGFPLIPTPASLLLTFKTGQDKFILGFELQQSHELSWLLQIWEILGPTYTRLGPGQGWL